MTGLRFAVFLSALGVLPAAHLPAQQAGAGAEAGPRIEHTVAAMRNVVADTTGVTAMARAKNVGRPVALMVVGGAAIILGSVVGGDAGTLFSIGGAIALLYGLYLYLR